MPVSECEGESGRRGSNPPPEAWKASALPNELLPLKPSPWPLFLQREHFGVRVWGEKDSNLRRLRQQIYSLPHLTALVSPLAVCDVCVISSKNFSGYSRVSRWTDSNRRPADYKSAALPAELHRRDGCVPGCECGCGVRVPKNTKTGLKIIGAVSNLSHNFLSARYL